MFEDKRKKKRKRILVYIFLAFIIVSFGIGYYLNSGDTSDVKLPEDKDESGYEVPDSLLNPQSSSGDKDSTGLVDDDITTSTLEGDKVLLGTEFEFKTIFKRCGHTYEKKAIPARDDVNLKEYELAKKYSSWRLMSFTDEKVVFERDIITYCPNHYILGTNNGYIGIYVYNQEGEKVLKQETDISIEGLTPSDQKLLMEGIVADTEDELNIKLEGFSN